VTAGAVIEAMRSLPGGIAHHPFVVDVNSVSPATKRDADRIVTDAGGRYVEAAVMTSVPPHGIRSPMLLGGRHANDWLALMTPFAMRLEIFGEDIGGASSVKMCRSVMIKGLEALATECLLAARHHGVDRQVLASLADTLPHADWSGFARYLIGRALVHGKRRAEEMDEVARMLDDAGIEPMLSRAVARRQQWAFEQGSRLAPQHLSGRELGPLLDALAALRDEPAPDDARLAIEPRTA
jgi:3-hydroxyisobutyrate dehydrogenase-like beta-hydroxyacid dehydrogenase